MLISWISIKLENFGIITNWNVWNVWYPEQTTREIYGGNNWIIEMNTQNNKKQIVILMIYFKLFKKKYLRHHKHPWK